MASQNSSTTAEARERSSPLPSSNGDRLTCFGRKGLGQGKGREYYRGEVEADPKAWLEVDFSMRGDWVVLNEEDTKAYTLEETIASLSNAGSFYQELLTPYKSIRAKVVEIRDVEVLCKDQAGRFTIVFEEEIRPSYTCPEGLLKVARPGMKIDRYHIEENFGLILEAFQNSHDVHALQASPGVPILSRCRAEGQIPLKLSGIFPSARELGEKVEQFKALMACPGLRAIAYKGYDYYGYLISGIQVKTPRENIAQLDFSWIVTDKIKTCDH